MNRWTAREGLLSIFAIFALNAVSFVLTDKSLPFSAEAIAGVVSITVAAVGITQAGQYFQYRSYSNTAQVTGQTIAAPGQISFEPPP